jgi:hypothetical protein
MNDNPFSYDYYIPTVMGGKDPIQFILEEGEVWLHQERNKWRKNGE